MNYRVWSCATARSRIVVRGPNTSVISFLEFLLAEGGVLKRTPSFSALTSWHPNLDGLPRPCMMATAHLIVGYCRVSTDGQSLDSQQLQLKAAGAQKVFSEKISGAKTDRRQLQRAIDALGVGDT